MVSENEALLFNFSKTKKKNKKNSPKKLYFQDQKGLEFF